MYSPRKTSPPAMLIARPTATATRFEPWSSCTARNPVSMLRRTSSATGLGIVLELSTAGSGGGGALCANMGAMIGGSTPPTDVGGFATSGMPAGLGLTVTFPLNMLRWIRNERKEKKKGKKKHMDLWRFCNLLWMLEGEKRRSFAPGKHVKRRTPTFLFFSLRFAIRMHPLFFVFVAPQLHARLMSGRDKGAKEKATGAGAGAASAVDALPRVLQLRDACEWDELLQLAQASYKSQGSQAEADAARLSAALVEAKAHSNRKGDKKEKKEKKDKKESKDKKDKKDKKADAAGEDASPSAAAAAAADIVYSTPLTEQFFVLCMAAGYAASKTDQRSEVGCSSCISVLQLDPSTPFST